MIEFQNGEQLLRKIMDDIKIDYEIANLGVKDIGDNKNVVHEIRFFLRCDFQDRFERELYVVHLNTDNLDNFINYEDLTKKNIVSWIEKSLGEHQIIHIKKLIEEKIKNSKKYMTPNF